MPGELIITNGDSAAALLKAAGIGDEVLPWRDLLHEGPITPGDDLAGLSILRANYLAASGYGKLAKLQQGFTARDDLLARNEDFDDVTLWFEHDLYDQLQLLQILNWFAAHWRDDGRVFLVQADDYLGRQSADNIGRFNITRAPITGLQLSMAKVAWAAFAHETPEPWSRLLDEDLPALPYLKPAVLRMLQELPSSANGLSRVEHEIIALIERGITEPRHMFGAYIETEEAAFLGDSSFFNMLDNLSAAASPLIAGHDGTRWRPASGTDAEQKAYLRAALHLTAFGKKVLAGRADHVAANGIDRWWGGTLLTPDDLWRWDGTAVNSAAQQNTKPECS